jgi:Xaa-Pro aminopeptidase
MVFSNEPGIYRPGVDGYRTIETMIATAQGVDVPSRFQTRRPAAERVIEP